MKITSEGKTHNTLHYPNAVAANNGILSHTHRSHHINTTRGAVTILMLTNSANDHTMIRNDKFQHLSHKNLENK